MEEDSGLWTAFYLKRLAPDCRIAILESNQIGFGASGRNGGWCSGFLPVTLAELEKSHGRNAAIEMYNESFRTIDEIEAVIAEQRIDCDYHRGGTINGATNLVQKARLESEISEMRRFGFNEEHFRNLATEEIAERLNVNNIIAATYTPHCAVVNPAKLVHGLANAVETNGVKIFEKTDVVEYSKGQVKTKYQVCRANIVIRATEGFTARLKRHRRTLAPLYSYMVATEPLTSRQLSTLGWRNRETYHDARNMIIYAQLTQDNRIAFGGRGAPYHFASRVKPQYDMHTEIHEKIIRSMHDVFKVSQELEVTHRWGGPLGVPRNWRPSVNFDRTTGLGSLGGYVGDGVGASNLAARTLAHLIVNDKHRLTDLPWVNRPSRKWETEPLRFVGINGLLKISESMDNYEANRNQPDKIRSFILEKFLGE
ncbi:MAG: FAD-dependent oxidoreductase [Acidimicrobiia bacterium]|nr:FAD-dependent oxidoreductase [Acidimicrobiia bacterium]